MEEQVETRGFDLWNAMAKSQLRRNGSQSPPQLQAVAIPWPCLRMNMFSSLNILVDTLYKRSRLALFTPRRYRQRAKTLQGCLHERHPSIIYFFQD